MKTFVIAEIGVNHNGSILLAKKMIRAAKASGASAVKFQSFVTDDLVTNKIKLANYQKKKSKEKRMITFLKKYELSKQNQIHLFNYCKKLKIEFMSSAFDNESLNFLTSKLKVKRIKIPSGELTNLPLLINIAKKNRLTYLSTGMSNPNEISQAIGILRKYGLSKENIILLHCNSAYPTPVNDANLRSILFLKNKFNLKLGYSDHTLGIEAAIAAVALGALVIEKHFTLDKKLKGPDHLSSLTPKEFKKMVQSISNIEKGLGTYDKVISKSEKENIKFSRKSIVAKKKIIKGEKFRVTNITTKRPGNGISPLNWFKVLNRKAIKNFKKDDLIKI